MFLMKKIIGLVLTLFLVGCSTGKPASGAHTQAVGTATTPSITASPTPKKPVTTSSPNNPLPSSITSQCSLLDSQDLASFYSSAEVVREDPRVSQVDQLPFSPQKITAHEVACTYFVYHLPGSKDMQMLQVDYWLDIPDHATPSAWAQVWTQASSQAEQTISGIGDGGFYQNGKLLFRSGDIYMTINVTDINNDLNTDTQAGTTKRIKIEKEIATDMLMHIKRQGA
jgi:hypothetical protein